ncbi:MAG: hypothetical protein R3212_00110 [Xanthomonadales bacterium]|nr:hypothetical protein [Xanthomonadales bacterium]
MSKKYPTSLPFESSEPAEQQLWEALADLPRGEPSAKLRQAFYNGLHESASQSWTERVGDWLGIRSGGGWVTVAACLLLGFAVAQVANLPDVDNTAPAADADRLAALEDNLAMLQRELILDRLQDTSVNTRLRGVIEASEVASRDPQVARALLERATQDRSISVRSAAIDALGPQVDSGDIGDGVMQLLENAESPIVQLALVDLVLRHGNSTQIRQLQDLAENGRLHPDLVRHVNNALGSQSI